MKKADLLVKQLHLNVGNVTKENIMKKKSTNPRMAMMMGRAMRRPALDVNPTVARPAINPMAAMAAGPQGIPAMKKGGKLFGGKETYAEELKEAKALKSGKISEKQFVRGEKAEGHKGEEPNPSKLAREIKTGRKSPTQYAKEEAKEMKMNKGGKCYAAGGRLSSKGEHSVQKQSKRGAMVVKMASGGYTKSADGCAIKGKTKGKMI